MQVNDEYLDELFAHKLGSLEATPPEDGWLRIENELNRRSRVMRKFWLAAASFALILSVTATMVYIQTNRIDEENNLMAMSDNSISGDSDSDSTLYPEGHRSLREDLSGSIKRENKHKLTVRSITDNEQTQDLSHFVQSTNENLIGQFTEPEISDQQIEKPEIETAATDPETSAPQISNLKSTSDFVQSTSKISNLEYTDSWDEILKSNETKSQPRNRWEVAGQFAPMQSYRAITSVPDGLSKSDFDDAEKPLPVFSGGIAVAYKLFDRLTVQTGVYYAQMGQAINNVTPVTNMYASISSNNSYSKNFVRTSSGSVTIASNLKSDVNTNYSEYFNPESVVSNNISVPSISSSANYRLIERLDYLEIPLMLRYKIVDRKMNFYVLGGMSTNVLINNNVFVDNGSELVKGGNILMARPVNYSSTFGLGLGYQISKKLLVGLEPSFKYYLQSYTINSRIGSNPYAFGLFTGAVYRF